MGTEVPSAQPDEVATEATAASVAEAEIERLIETDLSLVPDGPSQFVVAERLLEDEEVAALLDGLAPLLDGDDPLGVTQGPNLQADSACAEESEQDHEPHTAPTGCPRRHPQLSPLAWLFPDHAGARGPAGNQQGHDLRARRGPGKKARPAPRQAQGSLFGNHR